MKGKVTCELLNLRETPELGDNVIKVIDKGTELIINENAGDWLKVSAGDIEGYVMAEFVKIAPAPKPKKKGKAAKDGQAGTAE